MYLLKHDVEEKKIKWQLLKNVKNFSKKPIKQIDVISEHQLLISLSDGFIEFININAIGNSSIHSAVNKVKGATIFAFDIKTLTSGNGEKVHVIRLCAAIKKKLQLWYWKNGQFMDLHIEISLDDIPRALALKEKLICVGYKTDYVIFDVKYGTAFLSQW